MAGTIKIGDCLMLSQKSWRCSRSFTGTKNAPPEFKEIEHELARLAKSLKLLAECLFSEDIEILLSVAEDFTKNGIALVLDYCKHTLTNLESLIEQYQTQGANSFAVQKGWSEIVLQNYKQLMWTVDGGSIFILRDMLHMHVSTTAVIRQALDSKSRDRVEWTVAPVAERIQAMASQYDRDAGESIEGIERVVQALMDQSPALYGAFDRVNSISSDLSLPSLGVGSPKPPSNPSRTPSRAPTPSMFSSGSSNPDETRSSSRAPTLPPAMPTSMPSIRSSSRNKEARKLELRAKTSIPSSLSSAPQSAYYSPATSPGALSGSEMAPSEAGMWDNTSSLGFPSPYLPPKSSQRHWKPPDTRAVSGKSLPAVPKAAMIERVRAEQALSMPALPTPPDSDVERNPSRQRQRAPSDLEPLVLPSSAWEDEKPAANDAAQYSTFPVPDQDAVMLGKHMSTVSQQDMFEKEVFKNSAIYCDLRGKQVEFVLPSKDEARPHETRIESAMKDCRIVLVRRKVVYSTGEHRFTTSIWSFSEDRSIRLQQAIPDGEEIVPFSSYFQDEKVSLTIPTDLTFHNLSFHSPPIRTERSKWVNYLFEDDSAATTFQNALFGKTMLDTFKTEKTVRLRDGIKGAMAYQEQMCGMENLRLWSQEPSGAVLVMIHYSAIFRKGWLQFVINDKARPIKVKDDGDKTVKLKGLRIPDGEYPEELKKKVKKEDLKKFITGARVEFKDAAEKYRFLTMVRELQISAVTIGTSSRNESV